MLRLVNSRSDTTVAATPQKLDITKPTAPLPTAGRAAAAFSAVMAGDGTTRPKPPLGGPRLHPGFAPPYRPCDVPAKTNEKACRAVAAENRRAAAMDPADARWTVAVATAMAVEGGRAGIISAERRAGVLELATSVGLRPFDAAMIMAVVQDARRAGEAPLSVNVQQRLLLVGGAGIIGVPMTGASGGSGGATTGRGSAWLAVVWAVLLGLVGMWVMIKWVLETR